jgi:putative transposase
MKLALRPLSCRVQKLFRGPLYEGLSLSGVTKLTDARIGWAVRAVENGKETTASAGRVYGVSQRRIQQLVKQHQDTGVMPKLNPQRRPKGAALTQEEKTHIDRVWERTRWNSHLLYQELRKESIRIPKHKIHAYLTATDRNRPNPRKQKKRSRCRYERDHSGTLLHADWHQTSQNHPHCILWIDDASRKILGGAEFPEQNAEHTIATCQQALDRAEGWNLTVQQINTDRGPEFYANEVEGKRPGLSQFERFLEERGIRHIPSRTNNPQTNGKVERLWLEYDRHRWRFHTLEEWIGWKNQRVHGSLWVEIYETPEEAWQRKLPPESSLGLFLQLVEATEEAA